MVGASGRSGPERDMVEAARGGDQRALESLVAQSLPLVYNIVGRALDGHADVDDVVQETLLRVVRHLGDLRDPGAFRSWLVAIAVRQVRDREQYRRAALTRGADLDAARSVADPGADFAELTVARLGLTDQRREVAEATRWLDEDDRELLALWWLEEAGELDRAELAGALGLSGPHAAVRVRRMKEQVHAARTVVRALRGRPGCPELAGLTRGWDGTPGALWRKRLARHVRECATCGGLGAGMLPMDRLLAGVALVPVPAGLVAAAKNATARNAIAEHAIAKNAGAKSPGARGARHLPVRRSRSLLGLGSPGPVPVVAAAVGCVALVAFAAVHLRGPSPAPAAAAATTPPASPAAIPLVTSAVPSPIAPASPSPARPSPDPRPPATRPVAAPAVTTAKKGVCVWGFTGVSQALAESKAGWYYTWSTTHQGVTTPAGVGFVPMIWGASSAGATALGQARGAGRYLLGFNEPDRPDQANMTVAQALDLWPKLMGTGLTLGSPAVATGGDTPGGWLDQFMSGAADRGYRVDFIALHWYGGDFTTTSAVNELKSYLAAVYQRYHKPIWLTEYALINFSGGTTYPTEGQQAAFVTASARMLDGLPYVQRYAWFGLPASDTGPSSGLFHSGPSVTEAGRAFEAAG